MADKIPVFITSFNQLTWLRPMVDDLLASGVAEPIIVDNASVYEPLLEWFKAGPCRVVRRKKNDGPGAAWSTREIADIMRDQFYVVTDSDLGLQDVNLSAALTDMRTALDRWPQLLKAGLSLRLDDLPNTQLAKDVKAWESQFWKRTTFRPHGFNAKIGHTFALYRPDSKWGGYGPAWRSFYSCRHMPWYVEEVSEEVRGMLNKMRLDRTMWSARLARDIANGGTLKTTVCWQIPGKLGVEVSPNGERGKLLTIRLLCDSVEAADVFGLAVIGRDGYRVPIRFDAASCKDGIATATVEVRKGYGSDAIEVCEPGIQKSRVTLP